GSGAISLAVAQNLPECEVYALELSKGALRYLRENTKDCLRIHVLEADVLGDLAPLALPQLDMVISNPPYLTSKELTELPQPVRYEPKMALDGGEDGLVFYRSIAQSAKTLLKPDGLLLFEAGWQQAQQIADIMSEQGYHSIDFAKDLGGIDRCVYGRSPTQT
ncbi:MAG TPA: HemK/PrmC family methyltransferase, partial [Clostridia bacterium]|nr:HemK/PrmC family methyltransferase [Clostridia bacterium]